MSTAFQTAVDWMLQDFRVSGVYAPRPEGIDAVIWEIAVFYVFRTSASLGWCAKPFAALLDRIFEVFDDGILEWDMNMVDQTASEHIRLMCADFALFEGEPTRKELLDMRVEERELGF